MGLQLAQAPVWPWTSRDVCGMMGLVGAAKGLGLFGIRSRPLVSPPLLTIVGFPSQSGHLMEPGALGRRDRVRHRLPRGGSQLGEWESY